MSGCARGLLVAGTSSNAGKSTIVAGMLRWARMNGIRAVPFKGQNMALNSSATVDGGEIARAQVLQAQAAGVDPVIDMNPVLIKPSGKDRSQLVVLGRPAGELSGDGWMEGRAELLEVVAGAYERLAARADLVIAEGAGSAAEINLMGGDIANLRLARRTGMGAVLVGDIDLGGVFASLYGHFKVVDPAYAGCYRGFIINKLRGSAKLLEPGISELEERLSTRCFGVVPYFEHQLPGEDSHNRQDRVRRVAGDGARLQVAVVSLPYLSNFTDFDPLFLEPEVDVFYASTPAGIAGADLVVLPGTKATVADLEWLAAVGLGGAISDHLEGRGWLLGICGGYQMMAAVIADAVESKRGRVGGLALLDAEVVFGPEKVTRLAAGASRFPAEEEVKGYLIHHGRVSSNEAPLLCLDGEEEGSVRGRVLGTTLHGLFDSDGFRARLLARVAEDRGKRFASKVGYASHVDGELDRLALLLDAHLDLRALLQL